MPSPAKPVLVGSAALEAVASPARLELLSALGDGPATTHELARRLGRSRPSLYYHLNELQRAGLVAVEDPVARQRDRRFRLRADRLSVTPRRGSAADRMSAARAIQAMLRLTAREACTALIDPGTRLDGRQRELIGFRGKARLTAAQLQRANALIGELETLFRSASSSPDRRPYALTLVLTPARVAGPAAKAD